MGKMANKQTVWTSDTEATITFLDGPAPGTYHINLNNQLPHNEYVNLGIVKVDGKDRTLRTAITGIDGYKEHYQAHLAALCATHSGVKCERCKKIISRQSYSQNEADIFLLRSTLTDYLQEHRNG
jgi:hypothetical protein